MFHRVIVGISGGVDSAVAAILLKIKGFDVHGVFMKNWDEIDEYGRCNGEVDFLDAQWACNKLKIPLISVNFVKEYWNEVFGQFLQDYESGYTPNPDILCNRHIKFDYFYKYAVNNMNADAIATGHYAQSSFGPFLENFQHNQNVKLLQAIDTFKDQTFFLSQIPQEALQRTMFPCGKLRKNDVRQIAMEYGLNRLVQKRESTGICFVGKRHFSDFISEYIEQKPGPFIDIETGQIVGEHCGIHHWTIGQRCRLSGHRQPYFVQKKFANINTIIVSPGTNHTSLLTNIFYTTSPYWIDKKHMQCDIVFSSKFRFQHTKPLIPCTIFVCPNGSLLVKLNNATRAITAGQYAVFYRDSECLGSARIRQPGPPIYSSKDHAYNDVYNINPELNVKQKSECL